MREQSPKQIAGRQDPKVDELDRVLDAALATFSAAESRTGIEERILANLRAEQARAQYRRQWNWGLLATVATVFILALALAWRYGKSPRETASRTPPTSQSAHKPEKQLASNREGEQVLPPKREAMRNTLAHRSPPARITAAVAKLDQFPSPQPLSEQEKILANYVAKYPDHAVLIARARSEALHRDQLEEMRLSLADKETDSEERINHATER